MGANIVQVVWQEILAGLAVGLSLSLVFFPIPCYVGNGQLTLAVSVLILVAGSSAAYQ